jgi:hypothetical protein
VSSGLVTWPVVVLVSCFFCFVAGALVGDRASRGRTWRRAQGDRRQPRSGGGEPDDSPTS